MIFIFSIVLGAKYLFYVKSIETYARAFLTLNISAIGTVIEMLFGIYIILYVCTLLRWAKEYVLHNHKIA